jgi:hypothetical protein
MPRHSQILAGALAILLLSSPALASKFYRWVDDKGVTHYTQTPPPEGTSAREVRTHGPSSDQEQELEQLQERRQQTEEERRRAAQQAAEQQRIQQQPDQVQQERCAQHRKNLEELRNRPVVRSTDPVTGETKVVDAAERERLINQTLEALKLCD